MKTSKVRYAHGHALTRLTTARRGSGHAPHSRQWQRRTETDNPGLLPRLLEPGLPRTQGQGAHRSPRRDETLRLLLHAMCYSLLIASLQWRWPCIFLVVVLVALQQVDDSRARAARLPRAGCGRPPSPRRLRPSRSCVPRRYLLNGAPRRHREVVVVALVVTRQPALLFSGLGLGRDARSLWRRLTLGRLVRV